MIYEPTYSACIHHQPPLRDKKQGQQLNSTNNLFLKENASKVCCLLTPSIDRNYSETKGQLLVLMTESAALKPSQGRDCRPSQQGFRAK